MNSQWSTKISIAKLSYASSCKLCKLLQTRRLPRTSLPAWGSTADLLVMSWGWLNFPPAWNLLISIVKNLKVWLTRPTQVQTQSNARKWTTVLNALFAQKQEMQKISFFFACICLYFHFTRVNRCNANVNTKMRLKKVGSIGSISPGLSETDLDFVSASYPPCKLAISGKWSIILDLPVKWWLVLILTGLDVAKNQRDTSSRSSPDKCFAVFSAFRLEKV